MPKPKKKESKQDYLNRCTNELIEKEGRDPDQAYALCNKYWNESHNQAAVLTLNAPLELEAAEEEEGKPRNFMITAYTGKPIDTWWGRLVFDVKGMQAKNKIPALREHERSAVAGYGDRTWTDKKNFFIGGHLSQSTVHGKEIERLADEGFPWQASVGIYPLKIKKLDSEKETMKVNGEMVTGPAEVWTESMVGEISFVALGADDETAAIVLHNGSKTVPVEYEKSKDKGVNKMDLKELKESYPDLYNQIMEEGKKAGHDEGFKAGQEAERSRVVSIIEADGDREVTFNLIKDGTDEKDAFKHFYQAMKDKKDKGLEDLKDKAPDALGTDKDQKAAGDQPTIENMTPAQAGDKLVEIARGMQFGKKVSFEEAMRKAKADNPELSKLYLSKSVKAA